MTSSSSSMETGTACITAAGTTTPRRATRHTISPAMPRAATASISGDAIERAVAWKGGPDVAKLAGKPVRLRLVIKDADL